MTRGGVYPVKKTASRRARRGAQPGTADLSFEPRHAYRPFPNVLVELFPPRLLGEDGLSITRCRALAWESRLGSLSLRCRAVRERDGWSFLLRLSNRGADREVAVRYPQVHYVFPPGMHLRHFDPLFGGVLEPRQLAIERWYPGDASLCASFVAAADHAVGLMVFDGAQRRVRSYHLPGRCGQISIELERVRVRRGQTRELPPARVVHGRHWGEVLRPYRDWLRAEYPRRPLPFSSWYWDGRYVTPQHAHCLAPVHPPKAEAGVWIFDGRFHRRTLRELKAEVDRAFTELGRCQLRPLFYQFGWWKRVATCPGTFLFDAVCGDYTDHHALTKPIFDYVHAKGGRTFLYTNFISAGEDTAVFRQHPQLFVRDKAGFPVRNASYPMYLFCPGAPGLRAYWDAVLHHILIELDADGIFLDQLGGGTPCAFCYDPAHRHEHPDVYGRDYLALLDYVCRRARQLKPDCFLGGELTADIRGLWPDQMHGVGYSRPKPVTFASVEEAARTPPSEYFAFMNYINPLIAHLPSAEFLARGCPGTPDLDLWQKYRDVFRAGLQPCPTRPVGASAYLFGPFNGKAILATTAAADLSEVLVSLPVALSPADGGTHLAAAAGPRKVRVAAGQQPRYYRLRQRTAHKEIHSPCIGQPA